MTIIKVHLQSWTLSQLSKTNWIITYPDDIPGLIFNRLLALIESKISALPFPLISFLAEESSEEWLWAEDNAVAPSDDDTKLRFSLIIWASNAPLPLEDGALIVAEADDATDDGPDIFAAPTSCPVEDP